MFALDPLEPQPFDLIPDRQLTPVHGLILAEFAAHGRVLVARKAIAEILPHVLPVVGYLQKCIVDAHIVHQLHAKQARGVVKDVRVEGANPVTLSVKVEQHVQRPAEAACVQHAQSVLGNGDAVELRQVKNVLGQVVELVLRELQVQQPVKTAEPPFVEDGDATVEELQNLEIRERCKGVGWDGVQVVVVELELGEVRDVDEGIDRKVLDAVVGESQDTQGATDYGIHHRLEGIDLVAGEVELGDLGAVKGAGRDRADAIG
jgi:hypothetical protein